MAATRILGQVGGAVSARGASILSSFLLTVVVARSLSLEESGSFFLVMTAVNGFATFGRFGTDNYMLKIVGRPGGDVRASATRLLRIASYVSGVSVLVAGAVSLVVRGPVVSASLASVLIAATAVFPQSLSVVAGALLRARGHMISGTLAELGSVPALTILGVSLTAVGGVASLDTALVCLSVATWLTAGWSLAVARVVLARLDSSEGARGALSEAGQFRSLGAMMGTSLIFYVVTWMPVFALSSVGALEEVSLYTAAARLIGFISLIPAVQVTYLGPLFARLYERREIAGLNRSAGQSAFLALALAAVPSLTLIFAPQLVLHVAYGPKFDAAAPTVSLLAVAALLVVALGQVSQLMLLCDLEKFALGTSMFILFAWFAVGAWSASSHGVFGVAVVSASLSLLYAASAAIGLYLSRGVRSIAWWPRTAGSVVPS